MAIVMAACQTDIYKIAGTVTGYEEGDTFIIADLSKTPIDTLVVKKSKFKLKGHAATVTPALIYAKKNENDVVMFFKEPGTIILNMTGDASSSRVSGTKANDGLQALTDHLNDLESQFIQLENIFNDTTIEESHRKKYLEGYDRLQNDLSQLFYQAALNNIDNETGLFIITQLKDYLTANEVKELLEKMPEEMRAKIP